MIPAGLVRRVAIREYAPLAATVLAWLTIAATVGHADALRLFAALSFARSAAALTAPSSRAPLRKRFRQGQHERQATRVALRVEVLALAGATLVLAAILGFLWWAEQRQIVFLALLFAPALPVKLVTPLMAQRAIGQIYRPTAALAGLGLIAAGALIGADVAVFAALFAASAWTALLLTYAVAPQIKAREGPAVGELHWREIADYSHVRGRKQATYRLSKVFLTALLGPLGSIAARTGRGLRIDRRAESLLPTKPGHLSLLAVAAATASGILIVALPEPAILILAAALLRIAAAAANILLWGLIWRWRSNAPSSADEFDEDDEQ